MKQLEIEKAELLKDYKDILTIKEIKEILGIGKNKAYELVNNGTIPSFKIGTKYKITKVNLLNYLQSNNS